MHSQSNVSWSYQINRNMTDILIHRNTTPMTPPSKIYTFSALCGTLILMHDDIIAKLVHTPADKIMSDINSFLFVVEKCKELL